MNEFLLNCYKMFEAKIAICLYKFIHYFLHGPNTMNAGSFQMSPPISNYWIKFLVIESIHRLYLLLTLHAWSAIETPAWMCRKTDFYPLCRVKLLFLKKP